MKGRLVSSSSPSLVRKTWNQRKTRKYGKRRWFKSRRQVRTNLETIRSELEASVPGSHLEVVASASSSGQHSLHKFCNRRFSFAACQMGLIPSTEAETL